MKLFMIFAGKNHSIMLKLFFTLTALFVFTGTEAQDILLKEFKQKWENARAYTIEVAERMPESKFDYKPTGDVMSFREQLEHMMQNMLRLSGSYFSEKNINPDTGTKGKSKSEVLEMLDEAFRVSLARVEENFDRVNLDEQVDFFAGPLSRRQILSLMSDHVTHHRGQLIVYLRLNHIEAPRYRGW